MTRKGEKYIQGFVRKPEGETLNEDAEDNMERDLKEMEWKDGLDYCGS